MHYAGPSASPYVLQYYLQYLCIWRKIPQLTHVQSTNIDMISVLYWPIYQATQSKYSGTKRNITILFYNPCMHLYYSEASEIFEGTWYSNILFPEIKVQSTPVRDLILREAASYLAVVFSLPRTVGRGRSSFDNHRRLLYIGFSCEQDKVVDRVRVLWNFVDKS